MTTKAHQATTRTALCILALLCAATAQAAGLDCSKAQSQVDKRICSDADLKAADLKMAAAFEQIRKIVPDKEALATDQRRWLHQVRDRSASNQAVAIAYQGRTAYLEDWFDELERRGKREFSCPFAAAARDQDGCEHLSKCAANSDGSILEAALSRCVQDDESTAIKIFLHPDSSPSSTLVFSKDTYTNGVTWNFPDRNGFAELSVGVGCGSGACATELFRYDPEQRTMYHYHSGIDNLNYSDGYLLEHSGNSRSWEVHAYKVHHQGVRDVVEENMLVIQAEYKDDLSPGTCRFLVYTDQPPYSRTVKPPDDRLYRICPKSGIAP